MRRRRSRIWCGGRRGRAKRAREIGLRGLRIGCADFGAVRYTGGRFWGVSGGACLR